MSGLFLGLDVGTQGVKGLLFDPDVSPAVAAIASRPLSLIAGLPPGSAEQHPEDWWNAVVEVIRELVTRDGVDAHRIRGIGVSGQQHGSVFLDEQGQVLRAAKLWCDTSTAAEATALTQELSRVIPVGFTASKVRWLRAAESEHWNSCASVLLPHDFVNLRLTGRLATEAGDASGTGYFDVRARQWDRSTAEVVAPGLADKLPAIVGFDEPIGELQADAAETLGLPSHVLVAPGGGDNMMSAIGAGATRAGVVVMSLGTSGTVFTRCDEPIVDPEALIAPFCSSDGGWLPLLCVMNCTGVTEEVREAFYPDQSSPDALAKLTQAAEEIPLGSHGVTFVPYLMGERVPNRPNATGTIQGLRPGLLRPGVIFRAALEGVTCNLALGIQQMRELGVRVDALHLVGGGSKNPLWRQLIADAVGVPVRLPQVTESAALGAAIQAAWIHRARNTPALTCDTIAQSALQTPTEQTTPHPPHQKAWHHLIQTHRNLAWQEPLHPAPE